MHSLQNKFSKIFSLENLFPAVYVAAVFTVLLISSLGVKTKKDLFIENRKAASFPELSVSNYAKFAPQFEKWISDRFGKRKYYIQVWNALLLTCFHESHIQVLLGKEGFVFLASHSDGEGNRNSLFNTLLNYNTGTIRQSARELMKYKKDLDRSKPKILAVTTATKHSLNFDKLPPDFRSNFRKNPNAVPLSAAVTEELKRLDPQYAEKYFLDLYPGALALNREIQLIPLKNFHWIPGPYTHFAAHKIAQKLHVIETDFILDRTNYLLRHTESDMNHFLCTKPYNPSWVLSPEKCPYQAIPVYQKFALKNVPEGITRMEFYSENPHGRGGKILVIGDSFTNPLCQDLARYFSQVITMEFSAMQRFSVQTAQEHLEGLVKIYRPDYIVTVGHVDYIYLDFVTKLLKVL